MPLHNTYITGISQYLPNPPVENDAMEDYLGLIGGKSSRTKAIVLRNNGITRRHYALEKGGQPTHTNAQMAAEAARRLFDDGFQPQDLQLLVCGTASPDQLVPSHAAMVHGLLGGPPTEISSFSGSCLASIQALKFGHMSVATGNTANAVCTGSEMLSHWMLAKFFQAEIDRERQLRENPMLSFDKEFLRWMLSDGAGAVRLENQPRGARPLKVEWIDVRSYANEAETCMYVGAEKDKSGELRGWSRFEPDDWLAKSIFSVKQDTRLLGERMVRHGIQFATDVEVGNVATASFILMLEELLRSRDLQPGQRIMLFVPESARFSYAAALLTVC